MKLNNKLMKPIISACDYDTSIFGTPHKNSLIRTGNVVEINFIAPVIAQPSGNANIIRNLPRFANGYDNPIAAWVGASRYIPDVNSKPKQLWNYEYTYIRTGNTLLTVGNWLFLNLVYITSDTN